MTDMKLDHANSCCNPKFHVRTFPRNQDQWIPWQYLTPSLMIKAVMMVSFLFNYVFPVFSGCTSWNPLKFHLILIYSWQDQSRHVLKEITSLYPSNAIRQQGNESTLVQVMACCLTAPSHYLNQSWLIISMVLWHSSEGIIMRKSEDTRQ